MELEGVRGGGGGLLLLRIVSVCSVFYLKSLFASPSAVMT